MFKKVTLPLLLALVLSLVMNNTALAAPAGPEGRGARPRGGIGTVVSAVDGLLVVERRNGQTLELAVDDLTTLRELDGSLIELEDLRAGDSVLTIVVKPEQGELTARLVVRVPADFDPREAQFGRRAHGEVTAVDLSTGTFSLRTPAGEELTFVTDEGTHYLGSLESLADVEAGERVFVMGMALPDGSVLALAVGQRIPLERYAGTIVDVNPSPDSFSLETRAGEVVTISVDEDTRYKSRDGKINTLANLKPDMAALVATRILEDGTPMAVIVAAGDKPDLPEFEVKRAGQVTAVGTDSFTIQARDGEEYTFSVDEETRFVSRNQQVKSLADLEVGLRIGIGGEELDDGSLLAVVVLAGRPPER